MTRNNNSNSNKNDDKKKTEENKSLFLKVLTKSPTLDRTETLEALYWLKQIIGLIMGVVCGVVPLLGSTGITLFFMTAAAMSHILAFFYLKVDESEVGLGAALTEGAFTAFAVFLLTWICAFNVVHHPELLFQ